MMVPCLSLNMSSEYPEYVQQFERCSASNYALEDFPDIAGRPGTARPWLKPGASSDRSRGGRSP